MRAASVLALILISVVVRAQELAPAETQAAPLAKPDNPAVPAQAPARHNDDSQKIKRRIFVRPIVSLSPTLKFDGALMTASAVSVAGTGEYESKPGLGIGIDYLVPANEGASQGSFYMVGVDYISNRYDKLTLSGGGESITGETDFSINFLSPYMVGGYRWESFSLYGGVDVPLKSTNGAPLIIESAKASPLGTRFGMGLFMSDKYVFRLEWRMILIETEPVTAGDVTLDFGDGILSGPSLSVGIGF